MSKYNGYRNNALVASGWTHKQVEASRDKSAYRGIYWQPIDDEQVPIENPLWLDIALGNVESEPAETMGEPTPKKGKAKAEQEGN